MNFNLVSILVYDKKMLFIDSKIKKHTKSKGQ